MNVSSETNTKRYPPSRPLLDVIRPNFFPGQSLSDHDLTALMTWVEQRWRLEAACDDWGIACGLHVSINPDDRSQVLISPGYGFSAARQLCVVSDSDCGCDEKPRCKCRNKKSKTFCLPKAECAGCLQDDHPVLVGPLKVEVLKSELKIFDLRIAPHECEQQHTLGLTTDGRRNCNPSRFKASAAIKCQKLEEPADQSSPAIEFLDRYFPLPKGEKPPLPPISVNDVTKIASWLAEDIKKFPELLCIGRNLEKLEDGTTEDELTEILSWLVFGLRRARACKSSSPDDPTIPLCRIWAKCTRSTYEILWIDESAPFRRSLHCGPRRFCITDWIGESFNAAKQAAKLSGVDLDATLWPVPASRKELMTFLQDEIKLTDDHTLELLDALYVEMPSLNPDVRDHRIVVGFRSRGARAAGLPAAGLPAAEPPAAEPSAAAPPAAGPPAAAPPTAAPPAVVVQ